MSNSFNPQAGFPNNQKIGDYITIVSDNTGGNVAYAATYNVNPNAVGGHEQDVYYVRVFPTGRTDPNANSYSDCDADTYGYTTTRYTYVYATTNTDAQDHADAERSSYSTTEAESLIHE